MIQVKKIREFLWRILGFDYQTVLKKTDYTLLKDDKFAKIGNKTYENGAIVSRWTKAPLIIGKFCSIASGVNFILDEGHHNQSSITNFPLIQNLFKNDHDVNGMSKSVLIDQINQKQGITVGNDVWIGMGSYILPGVKIGNGVTIAANSVVTKDLEDYTLVAGVPTRLIKKKFSEPEIEALNKIAWWDWSLETIKSRIQDFNLSIADFIKKYDEN